MIQIRNGVFETNSSSTHSLCICTEDEFQNWVNGKMFLDYYGGKLIYPKDLPNEYKHAIDVNDPEYDEDAASDMSYEYRTYDFEEDYLEWYDEHFTTPSGDKMVVFGWFGRDG